MGNGLVNSMDKCMLDRIGKWIKSNKGFIYNAKASEIEAENAYILQDDKYYYAIIKDVFMSANANVQHTVTNKLIKVNASVKGAKWLDNGEKIVVENDSFYMRPFFYGTSGSVRVARFKKS